MHSPHHANQPRLNLNRAAFWMGLAIIAFYFLSSLWISYQRVPWYDEVLTLLIGRLQGSTFRAALFGAASSLPPAHFVVAKFFDSIFGPAPVAVRIPSALALAAGLLITFELARRATDNLHGLAALGLLITSLLPYYGYEARPYAPCFLLMATAMWLWTHPSSGRWWMALLFGATFLLAFSLHYYSVLGLVPFFLFEALQWKRWKLPSAKLVAALLGVGCGAVVAWPHMLSAHKSSPGFWAQPTIVALRQVFGEFFPFGLLIASAALIWIVCTARPEKTLVFPMLPVERLGWLSLSIPLAGYVIAKLVTNAFYNRYFIGMLPGIAVAFACALWRRFGRTPRVSAGIVAILLFVGIGKQVNVTARPWMIDPPPIPNGAAIMRGMLASEPAILNDGRKTIVISAGMPLGLEAVYHSKHPEVYAMLLHPGMGNLGPAHLNFARFYPLRFWTLDDLHAHAMDAALINPDESILRMMRTQGFEVEHIDKHDLTIVYPKLRR